MVKDRLIGPAAGSGARRPPRSLLFTEAGSWGSDPTWSVAADAVVLDATGPAGSQAATERLKTFVDRAASQGCQAFVAVDDDDPLGTAAVLEAALPAAPDGFVLMNSAGAGSVQRLGAKLAVLEAEHGIIDGRTRIIAVGASSAASLFVLGRYDTASARLSGLAWNAAALLGAFRIAPAEAALAEPLRLARVLTLAAAAAAGVSAIDTASPHFGRDLERECMTARRDGFGAKFTLDPRQVAIINAVFDAA